MPKEQAVKSKRQAIREQRAKRQSQQRLVILVVVILAALGVSALLILPSLKPVGDVATATPRQLPDGEGTALGDPNAPVLVEVWSDFQCPACKTYAESIEPRVITDYVASGKAHYVYRHYPFIDNNAATRESDQSANASMCAAEQGRFWEYHDIIFANWGGENVGAFRDKRLVAFAETINLDMQAFNACFNANSFKAQIEQDLADGTAAGVTGTPSVLVDGQLLTPGFIPQYEDIAAAIEASLAAKSQ